MIQSASTTDAEGRAVAEVWDLSTELYTRTVDGALVEERPMTAAELALYGPPLERLANEGELVEDSGEAVDKLVAVVDALNALTALTNAAINQNPAAVIKDLARECKTIARQANREARLTSGRTESTDTGDVIDT